MDERAQLVVELFKELVGPRTGPEETFPSNQDPRDEYICGVLAPRSHLAEPDLDADADDVSNEVDSGDEADSADQTVTVAPAKLLSPSLDPKAQPNSIGITFAIEGDRRQKVEVCATWARYRRGLDGNWQRQPRGVAVAVPVSDVTEQDLGDDVHLVVRYRNLSGNDRTRLSIFLVNSRSLGNTRAETPDFVFQPQIRIHLNTNLTLIPVRRMATGPTSHSYSEEDKLEALYSDRAGMARGHMCGTVWADIDPERASSDEQKRPNHAPFSWTDQLMIPTNTRAKFTVATVRTELMPMYPIMSPSADWPKAWGTAPLLSAQALSEAATPDAIQAALDPLAFGYASWIAAQHAATDRLTHDAKAMACENIKECEAVLSRIEEAISLLRTNDDARLAFCFANKAMDLQAMWARGEGLTWKPFQLAFLLLNVLPLTDPTHSSRDFCDLLWFPTGGGKTEAYLGVAAYILGFRRLSSQHPTGGAGSGVISRYTLRLLTIQQFRRTLGLITACEILRIENLGKSPRVGWRPQTSNNEKNFLWGTQRFSTGLWVGGNVTPNNLQSIDAVAETGQIVRFVGALEILRGARKNYVGPDISLARNLARKRLEIVGEPAQIISCPCCHSTLAVPEKGLSMGRHTLYFQHDGGRIGPIATAQITPTAEQGIVVEKAECSSISSIGFPNGAVTKIVFTVAEGNALRSDQIDAWWQSEILDYHGHGTFLLSARPCRPGYFFATSDGSRHPNRAIDFEIYCPNPHCSLNDVRWAEQVPFARRSSPLSRTESVAGPTAAQDLPRTDGLQWQHSLEALPCAVSKYVQSRMPIPAFTVDDQVYSRCPSFVLGTADKFARLAFEPRAAGIFGNVSHFHSIYGYYRYGAAPQPRLPAGPRDHPPGAAGGAAQHTPVPRFAPPDLIIQDELHLIEGPLGSMVGLYETVIAELASRRTDTTTVGPKYVASTATIRQASEQVSSVFRKTAVQFPPPGCSADSRFFSEGREVHPLDSRPAGRLYIGVCAPGKGAQTPLVRIWSLLLQATYELWRSNPTDRNDQFWTLVGYFNAIRELAGALSLYRQDIPERMEVRYGTAAREIDRESYIELSGRSNSLELPSLLQELSQSAPSAADAAFATSMFGTGVDVNRLGMMVVNGQPKTTSSYIQSTGRVGRQYGGLVVTFLRAARPRDLDHYEFFAGYHRALYKYVEPVTVSPFSPRARDRALGPICVAALRQADEICGRSVSSDWRTHQRLQSNTHYCDARRMATQRHSPEVAALPRLIEKAAQAQPVARRPVQDVVSDEVNAELDRWQLLARRSQSNYDFVYSESSLMKTPTRSVVLGDPHHEAQGLTEVFENAPTSLREVEATTTFKG